MKAHPIVLAAVLAACGASHNAATTDPCVGAPELCAAGVSNAGTTTTTAAGVQTTQKGTSNTTTTATKGGALPAARTERGEDATGRAAAPPREPGRQQPGNVVLPRAPRPINTGDPCGPCQ